MTDAEAILVRQFGEDSLRVARAKINRAEVLGHLELNDAAAKLYRSAIEIFEAKLPEDHPELTVGLNNLGTIYRVQGRFADAESMYRRAIEILERLPVDAHPDLAASLFNLARLYATQSLTDEAEPLFRRALDLYEDTLGPAHANVASVRSGYAEFLREHGRAEEAARLVAER
jgi:tetratricopeptide (TPR) repeat protein